MKAEVLSVLTIESEPVESLTVADPLDMGEWLRVMAAPEGSPGEESFDLIVCTPRWLEREVDRRGPIVGRHHLIVREWDPAQIAEVVTQLFESSTAENWTELEFRFNN
jgi:hypothetical protein